jgi:hypothetical protein
MTAMHRVYFDEEDEGMDGFGWNVVSDTSAIACRYATKEQAEAAALEFDKEVTQ